MQHKIVTTEVYEIDDETGAEISYDKQICEVCTGNTNAPCKPSDNFFKKNLEHYTSEMKRHGISLNRTI